MSKAEELKAFCEGMLEGAKDTARNQKEMNLVCENCYGAIQWALYAEIVDIEEVEWWRDLKYQFVYEKKH